MRAEFFREPDARPRGYAVLVFLILSSAIFAVRGPLRALTNSGLNDLISPYAQAAAWSHGADPYSPQSLFAFWPREALASRPDPQEFADGSILIKHGIPTAYPVTCFVVLAPFTAISWHTFRFLYILAVIALFFAVMVSLTAVAGVHGRKRIVAFAAALLFAPFHTGLATCNLAIFSVEIGILAVWANATDRKVTSGIMIALCVALKPQIGLCFLVFYLARHQWLVSAVALGGVSATMIVSALRLSLAHVNWMASYMMDNRALLATGVLGDFTSRNPLRFGLVNLHVALYPLIGTRVATEGSVFILSLLFFIAWAISAQQMAHQDDLLCLSTLAVLTLLPVYHRFYDAALLVLPLFWLLARSKLDRTSAVGPAALVVFFVPGGSLLETMRDRGMFPAGISSSNWWNSLVMAHAVWCILILFFVLLYHMALTSERGQRDLVYDAGRGGIFEANAALAETLSASSAGTERNRILN